MFTPKEIKTTIDKLNPKKAPGQDQITVRILQELPRKAIVMLTYIFNAAIRLCHFPSHWKLAKIIMIHKPGKAEDNPSSYRPISLLTTISELFERLYVTRLRSIIEEAKIIPSHQFGFRGKYASTEQIHRVYYTIREALERKEHCPAVFLDISQAFDRVWQKGLIHKISEYIPAQHTQLLTSYLYNRQFTVQYSTAKSNVRIINAGVPQGSVLGPLLYNLYTAHIPVSENTVIATFADDTVIISNHADYDQSVENLQCSLDQITNWMKKWKIKSNSSKSVRIDFLLRNHGYIPVKIDDDLVPHQDSARYLGVHFHKRLNWRTHITKKRDELNLRFRSLYWLFRIKNQLSLNNKRLLYVTILRPAWSYSIEVWGCAAKSNLLVLQRFQNKVMRKIT